MTTALVLLDFQRGIVASPVISWENPETPRTVLRVADSLLQAARTAGAMVVHVGVTRAAMRGTYDEVRTAAALKSGKAPRDMIALAGGTPDVEFVLPPISGEEVVHKVGVSAFVGTRLDTLLRNAAVRDVVIAGVFTHMVVESTARNGFDLGYRMTVVADACAAPAMPPHANALATGIPNFAMVKLAAEAVAMFKAA